MKSFSVCICMILMLAGFTRPRVDFSGMWRLDLKESNHLPPSYASLRSYTLRVRETRDSVQFFVLEVLHSGQKVRTKPTRCRLDGKEAMIRDSLPGYNIWISARLADSDRSLVIHKRLMHRLGTLLKISMHDEVWKVKDENTLQLSITDREEGDASTDSSKCIFRRIR